MGFPTLAWLWISSMYIRSHRVWAKSFHVRSSNMTFLLSFPHLVEETIYRTPRNSPCFWGKDPETNPVNQIQNNRSLTFSKLPFGHETGKCTCWAFAEKPSGTGVETAAWQQRWPILSRERTLWECERERREKTVFAAFFFLKNIIWRYPPIQDHTNHWTICPWVEVFKLLKLDQRVLNGIIRIGKSNMFLASAFQKKCHPQFWCLGWWRRLGWNLCINRSRVGHPMVQCYKPPVKPLLSISGKFGLWFMAVGLPDESTYINLA
jgi:hypothetical protein